MTTGNLIVLEIQPFGAPACATSCEFSFSRSLKRINPLPGTDEDDGWEHYLPENETWNLSSDGFVSDDKSLIAAMVMGNRSKMDVEFTLGVNLGTEIVNIIGDGVLSEYGETAAVKSLAKFSAKIVCNNTPEIEE